MPPTDPSTQISVMSESECTSNPPAADKEQRIREIVVLPGPEVIEPTTPGQEEQSPEQALLAMAQFVREKADQCQQLVEASSAVSFTANYLQSRVVSTELGAQLAKLYEILGTKRAEEFEQKLDELANESTVAAETVQQLREAFHHWEDFLSRLDNELERVAGPERQSELGAGGKEIQLVSQQGRIAQNGSLLSYVQSSSYSLMFLEVVASFAVQECYEHVKRMFDALPEFNKLGCDILLLTRRPQSGGGGFLKLIGMPFRMLLNESESMRQILMHRQSAQSMAGLRALHIYTEFLCNDHPLEIAATTKKAANEDKDSADESGQQQQQQSGCILLDSQGRILYSYLCTDSSDWPDVEVLLEQVRLNQARRPSTARSGGRQANGQEDGQQRPATALKPGDTAEKANGEPPLAASTAVGTSESGGGGEVAVHKRKCCAIM